MEASAHEKLINLEAQAFILLHCFLYRGTDSVTDFIEEYKKNKMVQIAATCLLLGTCCCNPVQLSKGPCVGSRLNLQCWLLWLKLYDFSTR